MTSNWIRDWDIVVKNYGEIVHDFLNIPVCMDVCLFIFLPLQAPNFFLILLTACSETFLKYYSIADNDITCYRIITWDKFLKGIPWQTYSLRGCQSNDIPSRRVIF